MGARLRKAALTAHITSSVGWLGSLAAFLALSIAGVSSREAQMVRGAYLAMDVTVRFVIVPLALASLLTGLAQSLGTPWGLFRHYWVLMKFLITVIAAVVLVTKLDVIGSLAAVAARTDLSSGDFREDRISLVAHAGGGLLLLLVPMVLSVFKPRGLTGYGRRRRSLSSAD